MCPQARGNPDLKRVSTFTSRLRHMRRRSRFICHNGDVHAYCCAGAGTESVCHTLPFLTNVALSLFTDFENWTDLRPGPHQADVLNTLLGEVIRWSDALAPLRAANSAV